MGIDRPRIIIGGIWHETNTFSPVPTGCGDFEIIAGSAILERHLGGMWRDGSVELIPTFVARAIPCGLVRREAYEKLKSELLREFRAAMPVDGVYLDLHGAMEVEGIGDGESDLIPAVREVVGEDALVAVSLDLHGNIAPALADSAEILTAFRTAPHRDEEQTRCKALAMLVRALKTGLRPGTVIVRLPLLLVGEAAMTDFEPAKSLYARLDEIDAGKGIMDSSLLVGCAYTDSPYTSVTVMVVAEGDTQPAELQAHEFAREVWTRRREFRFGLEAALVDEAIARAMDAAEQPVFLTDTGDNVTAGAAGDVPFVLERLLAVGAGEALVAGIADDDAVNRCAAAGVGAEVSLEVGGKLDTVNGKPLRITGTVEHLTLQEGTGLAQTALARVDEVNVVLTRGRTVFEDVAGIKYAGIDPMAQKIVVVKLGYLYPDLADHAPRAIMALSPGATSLLVENLPYRRLQRPIFPLDEDVSWEP